MQFCRCPDSVADFCLLSILVLVTMTPSVLSSRLLKILSGLPTSIIQSAQSTSLNSSFSGTDTGLGYWPVFPYTVALPPTDAYIIFISEYGTGSITEKWEAGRLFRAEIQNLATNPQNFHPDDFLVARTFTDVNLACRKDSNKSWTIEMALLTLDALESRVARWGVKNIDFEVWGRQEKLVLCALRLENAYATDA